MQSWAERQRELARIAACQLFFVGGAPRSGTTWLQHLLDAHPEVCCRGEGLFMKHLAEPLDTMMEERRNAVAAKNERVFRHSGGYPVPEVEDGEHLLATAILLALSRQCEGKTYRAVGEKTPENVFFFPRLKALFPNAKFIGVARDPRDVLASAWHFFHKAKGADAEKRDFIRLALPSLQQGTRAMLTLREKHPADCMLVTYERLHAATDATAAELFRFLGVSDETAVVAGCVARTSFAALAGGDAAFFRKGAVGDWPATLSPEMSRMIVGELGWAFPLFGWDAAC